MNVRILRGSKVGVVLLWAYVAAAMFCVVMLSYLLLALHHQDNQLRSAQERIYEQAKTSCSAIRGAALFWTGIRGTVNDILTDPLLDPVQRRAMRRQSVLLDKVIQTADGLPCPPRRLHG